MLAPSNASQEEREANVLSICEIPPEEMPDVGALHELVRRAQAGYDVYAYIPVASRTFVVWVRQRRPDLEARFKPAEWARQWRAGLQPCWQEDAPAGEGGAA